ncbi:major facilitator superfamily transporter [Grosmannia clavigera kw1407]|uniref:Major facilitator superfamily transporter n=1 Tax=Grosmannia clavigera (strain kw1407 / UAMH 11150) TaxID=655863 RepID=F0XPE6_GROCL|nr:major facilitator superfamily transporter [Grosmannia clavigera kw1407]EFX00468.1 major facilitator superfamily transporter [Grosmannia clavigera kw1407]
MGLGILEDRVMSHVPGTTRYFDDPQRPQIAHDGAPGLKCDYSGGVPIILIPQPSDDPNDPLNWPLWRRDLICFILSVSAIFATALGPILAANTITLSLWFEVDFTKVALLTGYFLLGVGFAGTFFVPSSRIWGKRHAFIFGICLLIASSVWAGSVNRNYTSMLWARIIQGVGAAPFEALVNASVGDLYFVHQRGKRMAFTNLAVFGGSFFTPILVGKITHTIYWWWTFYLVAIFCGACLPAIILFCPETAFNRDAALNTDTADTDVIGADASRVVQVDADGAAAMAMADGANKDEIDPSDPCDSSGNDEEKAAAEATAGRSGAIPAKKTWLQNLAPFDGRKSDENFIKLLLRPFPLFLQPAFLWASLTQGTLIGWTVFIGVIMAQFFLGYPLWWDEVKTGYAYTGAFLGAVLGFIIAGLLADWSAKFLTRRNKGIYEPEFRLVLVIPQLVFGVMGLYGFGITIDGMMKLKYHWSVPLVFFGFEVCGMIIGAVASSLYIVDAYRDLAIEGFTCLIIFKNFFSYGLTYKAYDWLEENGSRGRPVFNALGSVQLVICLLAIPMYVFGKRNRSFFHRHDLLKMFGLR